MASQEALDEHARQQSALLNQKVVTIYVRKGSSGRERLISVNPIPAEADPLELLNAGFAIDGNSATLSVYLGLWEDQHMWADPQKGIGSIRWEEADPESGVGPTEILNAIERTLVTWLKKLGYTPKFG